MLYEQFPALQYEIETENFGAGSIM